MMQSEKIVSAARSIEQVIITEELSVRPARTADYQAESDALNSLTRELAESPNAVLQTLVARILELCRGDSAGISILESSDDSDYFRWHSVAGQLSNYKMTTIPRLGSPCGTVLERNCKLLFSDPGRFFASVRMLQPPMCEVLIQPFLVKGVPVGTVWVVSHEIDHRFEAEDARLLENLSRFASVAYGFTEQWRTEQQLRASRAAALNLMEDAVIARKEAEQASIALRKSEKRFRLMADAVPQIVWITDLEGRIEFLNRQWTNYTGNHFQPETALEVANEFIHPEDRLDTLAAFHEARRTGGVFQTELRLRSKDGDYRWFLIRAEPYHDPISGSIVRWFGVSMDIHDRRLAEEVLRANEEQFRRAIEDAPIPVIMHAEDGQVLQISRTWTDLTGYSRDDIPTFDAWLNCAYGPGAEKVRDHVHGLFAGSVRQLDAEIEINTRTGQLRYWSFSASAPGKLRDGRRFVVGMALDITDRRRAEEALLQSQERLRLIVENAREYAIFSLDLDRRITSWNSGAERLLGYSEAEILGQKADIIFTPEDREAGAPEQEANTAMLEGRAADERWHVRKDSSRFWSNGVMMPMHDARGKAVGFVKIFRDQTKDLRAKEALERHREELWAALRETERAKTEAEAAGRAKDHFLAVLSHELRTPLNPVMIATRMLSRRKDLPPGMREVVEMIQRNVKLEAQFIDELLDLTRIARGKVELNCEPLDLHTTVWHAVQVADSDIQAKNQQLVISLDAQETEVLGDSTRLQQVLWNLLKNASKFSPEGSEIRISSRNEPGAIVLEVRDSGIGFEPEAAERIFEAFTQASESVTRKFGGLGLGLAISKSAVDAHHGELSAWSPGLNQGATFALKLPLSSGTGGALPLQP